jgi:hypothetical protein
MKKASLKHGTAVVATSPKRWNTGIVRDYNVAMRTYTVQLSDGRQPLEMPRLIRDPGDTSILARDTYVVVHDELGFPVIDAVLPQAPTKPVELGPHRISEVRGVGGEEPTATISEDAANFRQPNDPLDVTAGDRVFTGPEGNLLAVLAGGTNVMKSSPFAQVRTHSLTDMVEIISKVYRHITAMGDMRIINDGGKTSLIWRAGSDQTTENGAGEENWTIRLDVGATGDLFNFEVTTPHGNTLAKIHISADGRVEILGLNGVDVTSGKDGEAREDLAGSKQTRIAGNLTTTAKGNRVEVIGGMSQLQVSKNMKTLVGGSTARVSTSDDLLYVGGKQQIKIQGAPPVPPPSPGTIAQKIEIINGSIETTLGNPVSGALPSVRQHATWVNYVGGYTFVVQPTAAPPLGSFSVVTSTPSSVLLGANGAAVYDPSTGSHRTTAVATFGVMKYEPFAAMMQALLNWLDTHVHGTAMGPSSPALVPASPAITPSMPSIRSVRVAVGL